MASLVSGPDDMDEAFVEFSVQGQLFLFTRKNIMAQTWLLQDMLVSSVPVRRTGLGNRAIYLDVDPPSFRFISSIFFGIVQLSSGVLQGVYKSKMEWELLKATMKYLGCDALLKQFEEHECREVAFEKTLFEKAKIYDMLVGLGESNVLVSRVARGTGNPHVPVVADDSEVIVFERTPHVCVNTTNTARRSAITLACDCETCATEPHSSADRMRIQSRFHSLRPITSLSELTRCLSTMSKSNTAVNHAWVDPTLPVI